MDKSTFIAAYQWSYGGTKKHAEQVYKENMATGNTSYIRAIIDGYIHNSRLAFYAD